MNRPLWGLNSFNTTGRSKQQAIEGRIQHHNLNPKPFIWSASADNNILTKVTRAKAVLVQAQQ